MSPAQRIAQWVAAGEGYMGCDCGQLLELERRLYAEDDEGLKDAKAAIGEVFDAKFNESLPQFTHGQMMALWTGRPGRSPTAQDTAAMVARYVGANKQWPQEPVHAVASMVRALSGGEGRSIEAALHRVKTHVRATFAAYGTVADPATLPLDLSDTWAGGSKDVSLLVSLVVEDLDDDAKRAMTEALYRHFASYVHEHTSMNLHSKDLFRWGSTLARLVREDGQPLTVPVAQGEQWLLDSAGVSGGGAAYMAQVLSRTFRGWGMRQDWRDLVDERMEDPAIKGDVKAAWHLAAAYMDEDKEQGQWYWLGGWRQLSTALSVAESEPVRLAVLQWMVTRRLQVQHFDEALSLIKSIERQFESKDAVARLKNLEAVIAASRAHDAARQARLQHELAVHVLTSRIEVYERQLAESVAKGHLAGTVAEVQKRLDAVRSCLATLAGQEGAEASTGE